MKLEVRQSAFEMSEKPWRSRTPMGEGSRQPYATHFEFPAALSVSLQMARKLEARHLGWANILTKFSDRWPTRKKKSNGFVAMARFRKGENSHPKLGRQHT